MLLYYNYYTKKGQGQNDKQDRQILKDIKWEDSNKPSLNRAKCRIITLETKNADYHYTTKVEFWITAKQQCVAFAKMPSSNLVLQKWHWGQAQLGYHLTFSSCVAKNPKQIENLPE